MLSSVKRHGFGTPKSEETMKRQLTSLIGHLESLEDGTIDHEGMKTILMKAAVGVIMKIVANQDYAFDDEELEDVLVRVKNFMESCSRMLSSACSSQTSSPISSCGSSNGNMEEKPKLPWAT